MKKFINKNVCLLLIVSQILTSCGFTKIMWGAREKWDKIDGFFIDEEEKRVVLTGVVEYKGIKDHWHYSLTDPDGALLKTFALAGQNDEIVVRFSDLVTKGSEVFSESLIVYFNKKKLSEANLKKLYESGFKDNNYVYSERKYQSYDQSEKDYFKYMNANNGLMISKAFHFKPLATRYPSLKEPLKNLCSQTNQTSNCTPIIKFIQPWEGSTNNLYTTPEKIGLAAATPFTIAADIITIPLIAAFWLVFGLGGAAHSGTHDVTPKATKK